MQFLSENLKKHEKVNIKITKTKNGKVSSQHTFKCDNTKQERNPLSEIKNFRKTPIPN